MSAARLIAVQIDPLRCRFQRLARVDHGVVSPFRAVRRRWTFHEGQPMNWPASPAYLLEAEDERRELAGRASNGPARDGHCARHREVNLTLI
jgi:hypothetical protein